MKKLKTIIAILVLSFTAYSFQTNHELIEFERISSVSRVTEPSSESTFVYLEWREFTSQSKRQQIRNAFQEKGVNFIKITPCNQNSESWEIEEISYWDFQNIIGSLAHLIYDPTGGTANLQDPYPTGPSAVVEFTYNSDCSGPRK